MKWVLQLSMVVDAFGFHGRDLLADQHSGMELPSYSRLAYPPLDPALA